MPVKRIIIGTRGSALALTQAEKIKNNLREVHPEIEYFVIKVIKSAGDKDRKTSLTGKQGTGLFVRALEEALLREEIDLAVHSLKDLPTRLSPGLLLGAVSKREIPNDALVSKGKLKLADLPPGAVVATGSLRRKLFLRYHRPDLKIVPIRGNLDTRLKKLHHQNLDAIVVAACGLYRLGLNETIGEILSLEKVLPPAGQGCLAVEIREDDKKMRKILRGINHLKSWWEVLAEREFVGKLGGGCHLPVGVFAREEKKFLHIEGAVLTKDAKRLIKASVSGTVRQARKLGQNLANNLLNKGIDKLVEVGYG